MVFRIDLFSIDIPVIIISINDCQVLEPCSKRYFVLSYSVPQVTADKIKSTVKSLVANIVAIFEHDHFCAFDNSNFLLLYMPVQECDTL